MAEETPLEEMMFEPKTGSEQLAEYVKNKFTDVEDSRKHLAVRRQHPELDIRFVFSNCKAKLYKGSKTRYCDWCDKYEFKWEHRVIPEAWLEEKGKLITVKTILFKGKKKVAI